jgi:tetratricopeptide (TPR) repeat protein
MQQDYSIGTGVRREHKTRPGWRRWIAVVSLGFLWEPMLCPVVVPAAYAQTVPADIQRAYTLLGRGWIDDAIAAFEQAVRRYPQSIPAATGLAIAYRRAGQDENAWKAYQQLITLEPDNQLALKTVGFLGAYRSEWQPKGIEALTTLLNLNPGDTEARAQRALLYGYQGRFSEALADYQVALQSNPTPNVLLGAAQTYTYSGDYQRGLELFNRYRATGQAIDGFAAIAYSRALRETGTPAVAVQVLESQLQASNSTTLDERGIQTRAELSRAYLANEQPAQALAILDPLRSRAEAILPLARSLNEIGRRANQPTLSAEAADLYKLALDQSSNPSPQLVREVADVLSGVPAEQEFALQLYQQLARSQPDDSSLLVQQLALENQLGLISQTDLRQRLQTALQTLPTDSLQQRRIAQSLLRVDPPIPELLPIYQNLLATGVNEPFLNFRIAQIYIQNNQLAAARGALAAYNATSEGVDDQAPELLIADIERREGNLEASAQRYQGLIASSPTDPDILSGALQGLAGVRIAQGRPDAALDLYDQLIALNPQDSTLQLGRASLAYQARRITESEAEAILNNWLVTQPATSAPPELFSLVATLPANSRLEPLYNTLLEIDPTNIPVQLRLVQAIATRNPAEARARVARLIANDPDNLGAYFVQGELAQATGDLELADRAYQRILTQEPDNTGALAALGGVRFRQRRFDQAEELYSQALAVNPDDVGVRRALAGLSAAQDRPLAALQQLEVLQLEQVANGTSDSELSQQMQQLQEGFLRRRGFQPSWERY